MLTANQRSLIEVHVEMAEQIGRRFASQHGLRPDTIEIVVSEAYEGLIDAAQTWDEAKGPFSQYARLKIGYHLIDFVRSQSSLSRRDHAAGKQPVAEVLYDEQRDETPVPELTESELKAEELANHELLLEFFKLLPTREVAILALRYYGRYSMVELADLFGLTESRISQLTTKALNTLRSG